MTDLPLPKETIVKLGDRSYEKRKAAALEIENMVKELQEKKEGQKVKAILVMLGTDFARSTQHNHRKGGLIGLAAAAIGL